MSLSFPVSVHVRRRDDGVASASGARGRGPGACATSLEGIARDARRRRLGHPATGEELLRLSPRRGFLFTDGDPVEVVDRVRAAGALAYDATGVYAGIAIANEQFLRGLTDLDLDAIPDRRPVRARRRALPQGRRRMVPGLRPPGARALRRRGGARRPPWAGAKRMGLRRSSSRSGCGGLGPS